MKQPKTSEPMKIAYIGAAAAIIAAIITAVSVYLANNHPTSPFPSHTPTSATSLTAIPPTDTPVLSPTPTSKVVTINQTMTCTDCIHQDNYTLIVKTATVDKASRQVTMLIEIRNNTTQSFHINFQFLKLQDMQTGDTYDGTGEGFSEFVITANQVILVRPTFQFVPIPGHQYSLSAQINRVFEYYDFTPITITF